MYIPLAAYVCRKGVFLLFEILCNGDQIGYANVTREGLYFKIECKCKFTSNEIYRIYVSDSITEIMLGVCVPEGDTYVLKTRIPIKKLKGSSFLFEARCISRKMVLRHSGTVFPYLDRLETARLEIVNGQKSIIID